MSESLLRLAFSWFNCIFEMVFCVCCAEGGTLQVNWSGREKGQRHAQVNTGKDQGLIPRLSGLSVWGILSTIGV